MFRKILNKISEFGGVHGAFKTFYINLKVFPFRQAIKFPIWISAKSSISLCNKGSIKIIGPVHSGILRIGVHSHKFCPSLPSLVYNAGEIVIRSGCRVIIESGCFVGVGPKSVLDIQGNFQLGRDSRIVCHHSITIGKDNVWQEAVFVYDHETYEYYDEESNLINYPLPVYVGSNVWIQPGVMVKKGTSIPANSIVEMNSMCEENMLETFTLDSGCLISGSPAKVIRNNIHNTWKVNLSLKY